MGTSLALLGPGCIGAVRDGLRLERLTTELRCPNEVRINSVCMPESAPKIFDIRRILFGDFVGYVSYGFPGCAKDVSNCRKVFR